MWAGLKRARDQSQRFMTKPTHYILLPRDDMLTIISKKSHDIIIRLRPTTRRNLFAEKVVSLHGIIVL